jgi:hypothetical protein
MATFFCIFWYSKQWSTPDSLFNIYLDRLCFHCLHWNDIDVRGCILWYRTSVCVEGVLAKERERGTLETTLWFRTFAKKVPRTSVYAFLCAHRKRLPSDRSKLVLLSSGEFSFGPLRSGGSQCPSKPQEYWWYLMVIACRFFFFMILFFKPFPPKTIAPTLITRELIPKLFQPWKQVGWMHQI